MGPSGNESAQSSRRFSIQWDRWLAAIASICTICVVLFPLSQGPDAKAGALSALALSLLLLLCLILLAWREIAYSRKARYAEALPRVHRTFHLLRDSWYAHHHAHDSQMAVNGQIESALSEFASAMSIVTGVHCRACVKVLYVADPDTRQPGREWAVQTFVRDSHDPKDSVLSEDWVSENTDFEELLWKERSSYFLRNRLPYPGYKNSHWTPEQMERGLMDYAATIVWPIRKRLQGPDQKSGTPHATRGIIGFLCLDTRSRNVFNERYDVELGAAVADTLYVVLEPIITAGPADGPHIASTEGLGNEQ